MGTARKFLRATRFNSRAREGRDCTLITRPSTKKSFNSRAREGRDDRSREWAMRCVHVSIHAPVKGATIRYYHCGEYGSKF